MGVGQRAGALVIDAILWGIVVGIPLAAATNGITSGGGRFEIHLTGAPFLLFVALWLVYMTVMEAVMGASIGKLITKLRVVREDGSPIGAGEAVVRNLLRLVDGFPYFIPYLLGAVLVWTSEKRQRLGDRAARTIVVHVSRLR